MMQSALEPKSLADLLAEDGVAPMHKAIVASLTTLFPGISVRRHPGRMDISDYVAGDLYKAPTIAVATVRLRSARQLQGTFALPVDWAAYLVVEDAVIGGRRVERVDVAQAIGGRLLRILQHATASRWGLDGITDPDADPEPELKPVFTADSFRKGVGLYAVTWRQGLAVTGDALWDFTAATPPDLTGAVTMPGDPGFDPASTGVGP